MKIPWVKAKHQVRWFMGNKVSLTSSFLILPYSPKWHLTSTNELRGASECVYEGQRCDLMAYFSLWLLFGKWGESGQGSCGENRHQRSPAQGLWQLPLLPPQEGCISDFQFLHFWRHTAEKACPFLLTEEWGFLFPLYVIPILSQLNTWNMDFETNQNSESLTF